MGLAVAQHALTLSRGKVSAGWMRLWAFLFEVAVTSCWGSGAASPLLWAACHGPVIQAPLVCLAFDIKKPHFESQNNDG